ncbi:hypothetical protein BOQ62_21320 [Chryseobacterium sp. CH21]|nr:hypothetical protein BOQ62_21320 [Chryseobacterium sp. CH21]
MGKIKFSPLGEKTFLISFLLGTSLLLLFWMTRAGFLIIFGFYYVVIAAVVNLLIILYELMEYLSDVSEKRQTETLSFYCWLIFLLLFYTSTYS